MTDYTSMHIESDLLILVSRKYYKDRETKDYTLLRGQILYGIHISWLFSEVRDCLLWYAVGEEPY